jgi:hypothetical protein
VEQSAPTAHHPIPHPLPQPLILRLGMQFRLSSRFLGLVHGMKSGATTIAGPIL